MADWAFRNYLCYAAVTAYALLAIPGTAHSAPFCVEGDGIPQQCVYYDTKQCWQDANRQKARCSVNIAELNLSEADNSICMVDSARMPVCGYQNLDNCQAEARKQNAVCFQNDGVVASDDPYRLERTPYR
ncbi:MAG TPA: DUF3551 domain-containing protein [Patescibacteria group bacterium]|nr:DUF3551 domain-containing protein [Patescibacteria group bacterium]